MVKKEKTSISIVLHHQLISSYHRFFFDLRIKNLKQKQNNSSCFSDFTIFFLTSQKQKRRE